MKYTAQLLELENMTGDLFAPLIIPPKPPEPPEPLITPKKCVITAREADAIPPETPITSFESIELERNTPRPTWRDRDPQQLEVAAARASATGAGAICALLRTFAPLFRKARRGQLPTGDCAAIIDGESSVFENVADTLLTMEIDWTTRATACSRDGRELTVEEAAALSRASQLLEWVQAARNGDTWLDLEAVADEADQNAKERARLRRKQLTGDAA